MGRTGSADVVEPLVVSLSLFVAVDFAIIAGAASYGQRRRLFD